jgi:hypothetical protein
MFRRTVDTSYWVSPPQFVLIILVIIISGVRLSPLGTAATNWPIVPSPDDGDCETVGGMRFDKGNWSAWRQRTSLPLCSH